MAVRGVGLGWTLGITAFALIAVGGIFATLMGTFSRDQTDLEAKYLDRSNPEIERLFPVVPSIATLPNNGDFDNDGLTNAEERALGTSPYDPDTDDDGISDGEEKILGSDPGTLGEGGVVLSPQIAAVPEDGDSDNDGLTNAEEQALDTDPRDPDSDNDGISDGEEVANGTDPNDASDPGEKPRPQPPPEIVLPPPGVYTGNLYLVSGRKQVQNLTREGELTNFGTAFVGDRVYFLASFVIQNTGETPLELNIKDYLDNALHADLSTFRASGLPGIDRSLLIQTSYQSVPVLPGQHNVRISFEAEVVDIAPLGVAFNQLTLTGERMTRTFLFAALKILNPKIFVTSPSQGSIWTGGNEEMVQWISQGLSFSQKINITLNVGGAPLYQLAQATPNDHYEKIIVPNLNTDKASVTVSAIDEKRGNILASGTSGTFVIRALDPSFTILSPSGGSTLTVGEPFTAQIAATLGSKTTFSALLSTDGGQTFQSIAFSLKAQGSGNSFQLYVTWSNTNFPETSNAILKLNRYDGNEKTFASAVSPLKLIKK